MNRQIIDEIQEEVNRFQKVLTLAKERSRENKGYFCSHDNKIVNIGEISGTKESAAVKRSALDLKRLLTDKL